MFFWLALQKFFLQVEATSEARQSPRPPRQPISMVAPTPPAEDTTTAAAAAPAALPVQNEFEEPDVAIPAAAPVAPDVALKPALETRAPPQQQEAGSSKATRPTSFTSWIRSRGSSSQDADAQAQVI